MSLLIQHDVMNDESLLVEYFSSLHNMLNSTLLSRVILSRPTAFVATHGLTTEYKDYLSLTKDQGQEGLCWAFALTSAIEMNYALQTGNRMMLDPKQLSRRAVSWWKGQKRSVRNQNEHCLSYGEEGGYNLECAINYLLGSKESMIDSHGDDTFIVVKEAAYVHINSLHLLYESLNAGHVIYSGVDADGIMDKVVLDTFYKSEAGPNHAVVITAAGTITGKDGIYVEILNSWGVGHGYEGLQYIKVAENNDSYLINNAAIFEQSIIFEVGRDEIKYYAETITIIVLSFVCFGLLIALIVMCIKYHRKSDYVAQVNDVDNDESPHDESVRQVLSV